MELTNGLLLLFLLLFLLFCFAFLYPSFINETPQRKKRMTLESTIAVLEQRFAAAQKRISRLVEALHPSGASLLGLSSEHLYPNLAPCSQDTAEVAQVRKWCIENKLYSAVLHWVPSDYYSHSLQWRRDILQADSINHLCKSILMENTHCDSKDCSNPRNSRYYMVLFQYIERIDAEKVMRVVKSWNEGVGKKKFNFRVAPSDISEKLTGFKHGGVVPFCNSVLIPVIMSSSILSISPPYIWVGAGHIDCKLRVNVHEFIRIVKPEVAPVTVPLSEEELMNITD